MSRELTDEELADDVIDLAIHTATQACKVIVEDESSEEYFAGLCEDAVPIPAALPAALLAAEQEVERLTGERDALFSGLIYRTMDELRRLLSEARDDTEQWKSSCESWRSSAEERLERALAAEGERDRLRGVITRWNADYQNLHKSHVAAEDRLARAKESIDEAREVARAFAQESLNAKSRALRAEQEIQRLRVAIAAIDKEAEWSPWIGKTRREGTDEGHTKGQPARRAGG